MLRRAATLISLRGFAARFRHDTSMMMMFMLAASAPLRRHLIEPCLARQFTRHTPRYAARRALCAFCHVTYDGYATVVELSHAAASRRHECCLSENAESTARHTRCRCWLRHTRGMRTPRTLLKPTPSPSCPPRRSSIFDFSALMSRSTQTDLHGV